MKEPGATSSERRPGTITTLRREGKRLLDSTTKAQWVLLLIGLILLFTVPQMPLASAYWLSWLTRLAIIVVAVLGLHVLTGLCGQFSLGQSALLGVGAYTAAILSTRYGFPGWVCLPLSGLGAGLVGILYGLPCFRLRGFYLAMSTLLGGLILIWCMLYFDKWTGGFIGLGLEPLKLGGIDLSTRGSFYILAMAIMVLATIAAKIIQRSSTGRAFVAIRDNEPATEVGDMAIFRYKLLAFFIGCFFAGIAGWLWAYSQLRINPDQFGLMDSLLYVGMLIIGGVGRTTGVFAGVIFVNLVYLERFTRLWNPYPLTYILMVLALMIRPQGLLGLKRIGRSRGAAGRGF